MKSIKYLSSAQDTAQAIQDGKVVVVKTDTLYGLCADATNISALNKVYQIKKRSTTKSVPLLLYSVEMAKKYVLWSPEAEKLASQFWPGPLTLVLLKNRANFVNHQVFIQLDGHDDGYIGIRVPKKESLLELLRILDVPVTGTSANLSGNADPGSLEDLLKQFEDCDEEEILIWDEPSRDGEITFHSKPSTIVALRRDQAASLPSPIYDAESRVEILREGVLSRTDIYDALASVE